MILKYFKFITSSLVNLTAYKIKFNTGVGKMRLVRLRLVRLATRVICVQLVRPIAAVKVCLWRVNCVYTKVRPARSMRFE